MSLRSDLRLAAQAAESQAVAHALANQQIAEEQQMHLFEEAAREAARIAAGATSPESGATPITPEPRDPGPEPAGTGQATAGTLTGVGEDLPQDGAGTTPPKKKKRIGGSTRRIILDDEWKDGEGFIPEWTLTGQPFDMEDEAGAQFYESAKAPSIFGGARAHPQDPRRSSNPVKPSFQYHVPTLPVEVDILDDWNSFLMASQLRRGIDATATMDHVKRFFTSLRFKLPGVWRTSPREASTKYWQVARATTLLPASP